VIILIVKMVLSLIGLGCVIAWSFVKKQELKDAVMSSAILVNCLIIILELMGDLFK
jgi:hypothetical protein